MAMNENLFSSFKKYVEKHPRLLKSEDHMGANVMFYAAVN